MTECFFCLWCIQQPFVIGNLLQECVAVVFVVHAAAVVLHSVTHYKVIDTQCQVVARYLCKDLLCELYCWRLVLDNHPWT